MYPPSGYRIPVLFQASDPLTEAGVAAALRARPELALLDGAEDGLPAGPGTVGIVVADQLAEARHLLGAVRAKGASHCALVLGGIEERDLIALAELGIKALARRAQADSDTLVALARTAADDGVMLPPDLLCTMFAQLAAVQRTVLEPRGLDAFGMSEREREVLRLVAQGLETREIAERMFYSERTVKTILHDITNRFQLRNRSHAVAYAMREGLI
jgi:DNA-binding NarL/FixJ family response regulator